MPPSLLEVVASANVSHVVVLDDRYWGSKLHGQVRLNISDLEVRILFSAPYFKNILCEIDTCKVSRPDHETDPGG